MPDKNIFCNTPWYELHIYWDGSFGTCCQEAHKLYPDELSSEYNIAKMSIAEWFNSEPARNFRLKFFENRPITECSRCTSDELHGGNSRRLKSNMKSVIFTRSAFDESYLQSPGYKHFQYSQENCGFSLTHPIDIHVDLGNFCNLACKMCKPSASSTYAVQEVKWGNQDSQRYIGTDWTRNETVWKNFKQQILEIPKLTNIHFMGGETLLTARFEDLVDTMIEHRRFDLCFSFVTNGTVFNELLINKLKKFRRVGIEISLETITEHNMYQRQGTDNLAVLENIRRYQEHCNGSSVTVTLRPAPSILTIGYMDTLIDYALEHQLVIKFSLCYKPEFLNFKYLPESIKKSYKLKYQRIVDQLANVELLEDYNSSDPNNCQVISKEFANTCISLLSTPTPTSSEVQLEQLVRHCEKWDSVYGYDARKLYPEWQEFLDRYGYNVSG